MMHPVVLHNDEPFGSVAFAKLAGIAETLCPGIDLVDASQHFETDNVRAVSAYLYTTVPFWPAGTVFLSLVGKGEAVAVRLSNGTYVVSGNNGTVTMSLVETKMTEAVRISPSYGNDGYELLRAAVDLAKGKDLKEVGETLPLSEVLCFRIPDAHIEEGLAEGEVGMLLKNFGNITFNIRTDDFEKTGIRTGDPVRVTFSRHGEIVWKDDMTYQPSFGYVPEGSPVVFNGSSGYMDIGLNKQSFIRQCIPGILEEEDIGSYKVRIERIG